MGYGLPKIQNTEIKQAILKAVEEALDKQGDVFQGSQAYYGFAAKVEVNLHLVARGVQDMKIVTGAVGGEKPEPPKAGKLPPPVETTNTTTAKVTKGPQGIAKTGE